MIIAQGLDRELKTTLYKLDGSCALLIEVGFCAVERLVSNTLDSSRGTFLLVLGLGAGFA